MIKGALKMDSRTETILLSTLAGACIALSAVLLMLSI